MGTPSWLIGTAFWTDQIGQLELLGLHRRPSPDDARAQLLACCNALRI